jgi:HSP20 family molecular chaperone IbpA
MWAEAFGLLEQAERMHRQFFRLASATRAQPAWEPPVDVFDDGDELVVVVAMPGVPPERVEATLEPGALVVRGERPVPFTGARQRVRQLEIPYGFFERRIPLPARIAAASTDLAHGVLVVRLVKASTP